MDPFTASVETVLLGATFERGMEFNLEFRLGHCYHEFRERPSFCVPAPVVLTGLRLDSVIVCRVRSLHGLSAVVCRGGALSDRLFCFHCVVESVPAISRVRVLYGGVGTRCVGYSVCESIDGSRMSSRLGRCEHRITVTP